MTKKARSEKPWPKLSESLPYERNPGCCQACGSTIAQVARWREYGDNDRPTSVIIVLCTICSDNLIEPHPRIYEELQPCEPDPGSMTICSDCIHRKHLCCQSPLLKANGGPGLRLQFPKPSVVLLDGQNKAGRRTGWSKLMYRGPVTCAGRQTQGENRTWEANYE